SKLEKPDYNFEDFKTCRQYVGYIERESQRCKKIVENLLTFSRKSPDVFQPVDIKSIMENTLSIVRHSLESKNIKITTDYSPDLPLINGNANQLQQVFTNIIINAQQAMPQGGQLDIRVRVVQEGEKKNMEISFQDTGCGIPKENLERIFEPFFTTKGADWKSVGLGLSICYQIIEQHKGRIVVDSQVGKGSTFTVVLPCES
ncbi:MAG: ATP-binding protein, partial [Candidatus Omnitrophica bacterium]|nr:ATP-binding protein [Candidatus Omnitrophota bacterium]